MSNTDFMKSALELGTSGFMLLIVLMLTFKMYKIFEKIPEKFDLLTQRLEESNKDLSSQLIKTAIIQESILSIIKETIVSVNNNTLKMVALENKIENSYEKIQEISKKTDDTIEEIRDLNSKFLIKKTIEEMPNQMDGKKVV